MAMQKVLITGGAGYIGTALCAALSRRVRSPLEVVIYDNLSRGSRSFFLGHPIQAPLTVRFVQADILDTRRLAAAVAGCDAVVHLAARVTTPFANDDPHLYEQVNHWGAAELSYILERDDIGVQHLIFASSTAVYGGGEGAVSVLSSAPQPQTWYGTAKLRGEQMLARLTAHLPRVHILRCGNVYGYSRSMRFDAVINRFLFEAHHVGRVSIHGDGSQGRAFIHIDHVAETLAALLGGDPLPSGTYDLIDRNLSVQEITDTLQEMFPALERLHIEQDMPRHNLLVRPDPRILDRGFFQQRPLLDELTALRARFST